MSQVGGLSDYSRQDLRKATKFVEGDYSGINPRRFYRSLKRSLEEIQEDGDFKYQTFGDQETDLAIKSESVGEKTGTVKGRLVAESDWREIGTGTVEYKPYGKIGALGLVTGLLVFVFGLNDTTVAVVGLFLLALSGYAYSQSETGEFPILRQDVIRTLITGEVSERTVDADAETRTDIFANMSVVYSADAFVGVDVANLGELDAELRRELAKQVQLWNNQVVDDEREQVNVDDGFLWHLTAWTNSSLEEDRRAIEDVQTGLLDGPFEYRERYSNLLEAQLPDDVREDLRRGEDKLMVELESLADDLDVYVEREGLQRTNTVQKIQEEKPELGPGDDT